MKVWKCFLSFLLILALATGVWLARARHLTETNNRRVELAVDARLLSGNDAGRGYSLQEKLFLLQEAGCTAVAVSPLSLNELEKRGELTSLTPTLYIVSGGRELAGRLHAALSPFLPEVVLREMKARPDPAALTGDVDLAVQAPDGSRPAENNAGETPVYQVLELPGHYPPAVKELPLFLPRAEMLAWQRAGLRSVPMFNYPARLSPRFSEKYWEVLARQLQETKHATGMQFGPVAFPANSFSYPAPQGVAGTIFREEGFSLGAVEFTQGQGLRELAAALDYRLLRTHLIPGAELAQLDEVRARERFQRAVQERKVRLLLLQPFPDLDPRNAWESYLPLIQNLNDDLQRTGFSTGVASFFPFYRPPAAAEALLGAGIAAAAVLLAGLFLNRSREKTEGKADPPAEKAPGKPPFRRYLSWFYPLAGSVFILAAAGFLFAGERLPFYILGRQLAALAAALVFPLFSTVFFLAPPFFEGKLWVKREKERKRYFLARIIGGFLLASLLTTGGALLAAGLLGSTPFLLKIEAFRGVKIAQAGPFLLLGLWFLLQGGRGLWRAGRNFWETRLQIKHLILLALAGGILLIYLLRGGNTAVLPVSGLELALRRQLEMLLVARPRFKEFLIGHPGFFFFAALVAQRWRGARILALLCGLLGQVSLFNTFMHLHRPVGLSLLGTAYGAGLGLLGGLALYALAGAVSRRWFAYRENN